MRSDNKREVASSDQSLPSLCLAAQNLFGISDIDVDENNPKKTIGDAGKRRQSGQSLFAEDFAQIIDIDLAKSATDGGGLGFSIVLHSLQPEHDERGIYVASVIDESPAKRAGLRVNDEIQAINGVDMAGCDRVEAAVMLRLVFVALFFEVSFGTSTLFSDWERDVLSFQNRIDLNVFYAGTTPHNLLVENNAMFNVEKFFKKRKQRGDPLELFSKNVSKGGTLLKFSKKRKQRGDPLEIFPKSVSKEGTLWKFFQKA